MADPRRPTTDASPAPPLPPRYRAACRTWRIYLKDRHAHPYLESQWPECAAVERASRDQLLALQQSRWQSLLGHLIRFVPYYRHWAKDQQVDRAEEIRFEDLPILSKRDYIEQPEAFRSEAFAPHTLRRNRTSGSSGQPFDLLTHARARDYSYACNVRALWRHGVRPGDPRVLIWGDAHRFAFGAARLRTNLALKARDWFNRTRIISAYDLSEQRLAEALRVIERTDPVYLHGYVSAVHTIALHVLELDHRLRVPRLKLIVVDAEKLHATQRETIARAFGCRVVEHYGCMEVGNIAQEDPEGRRRINEDYLIVEHSPRGEIMVTHTLADAMPFVRYRLGDLVELEDTVAPPLPYRSIRSITGRVADLLPLPGGGAVHGLAVGMAIYRDRPEIRQYQIHQTALDTLEIRLVLHAPLAERDRERVVSSIRELVGEQVRIHLRIVDRIPTDPSGKVRLIQSDASSSAPSE